jgi:hypothetical protein
LGVLACSFVALFLAGSGGAGAKYMETTLQDDALFLHRPAPIVRQFARLAAGLGADRLRLTAGWSSIAPQARSRHEPGAPFDATDSRTYPQGTWSHLDMAVKAAHDAGLAVQIDLAFWAPRWAVRRAARNPDRQRWWPDAEAFGAFATAAAHRYSGGFPDPAARDKTLPAVRMWTTWNEPNHPSFLAPQWARDGRGGWRAQSPHIYRAMHNAAYDAIKQVDGANQKVLVGATAATGSAVPGKGAVPPLEFARALACVDDELEPLRIRECAHFQPIRADGWAHHPYSRWVTPGTSNPDRDQAPIADVGRLGAQLDALWARGRFASHLPVYNTEYGYETKQDDPYSRFTREQQAQFMGWSTYLAWADPGTRMFAQFLLRDIDPRESGRLQQSRSYYRDWQTGLYTSDGQPKPAAQAFKLPFWAETRAGTGGKAVLLFGQVRPGQGRQIVRVERQDPRTGAWSGIFTVGRNCDVRSPEFLTDGAGFFLRTAPALGPASYRFSWRRPDGAWETSAAIPVAADPSTAPPL